jgi:16S rRNA (guanine1207-N2)-methyltransferase
MSTRLINPTSALIANTVTLEPGERVLLLHSGDAALARWLIEQVGTADTVAALHTSICALETLARVDGLMVYDDVYPNANRHGVVSTAILNVPKGRDVARAYLWTVAQVLRPGGRLFVAGPNARGARSVISDAADLYGDAPVLGYKSSRRIAVATRPETVTQPPAWEDERPWQMQMRAVRRPEGQYMITTMPGVFSWEHLDEGTALLLDHLDIEPDTTVLDIGCGYGIIGLVAARAGAQHVTMLDDNLLAVRCARAGVISNQLNDICTVLPSDVTSAVAGQQFDMVLSNPPFHRDTDVNTAVATRIVREAADVLVPGGRLRLVANRFLPYDRVMREKFGNVRTVTQTGRYHVLESVLEG